MVKELLKKYWWVLLIIAVVLTYIIYLNIQLNKKNSIIYYKDSVITLNETQYKTLSEEYINEKNAKADLERYNKVLASEIEKANEIIKNYSQLVLAIKTQHYTYRDTVTFFEVVSDTIRVPIGKDSVRINLENSLYRVYGTTFLYPKKGYDIDFFGKNVTLDVVVTEDDNGIYNSYVDLNNPDLQLIKFKTRFLKSQPSFWSGFRSQVGLNFTNKNAFLDAGVSYGKWGVKGIIGMDYQQVTNQQQLIYGGGLTFSPF